MPVRVDRSGVYNFGVYHWRRRLGQLLFGLLAVAVGIVGSGRECDREEGRGRALPRLLAAGLLAWGGYTTVRTVRRITSPPPWRVDGSKYETLASMLPFGTAGRVVDVGCGTGRSLVGLAPAVPDDATVVALDVFDDRVILGNAPTLARRNAAEAGLPVAPVRGDAAALPLGNGTVDVLTACRVLHDLPRTDAERTLSEARRVLSPHGTLGVLELPIPHDEGTDPRRYWRGLVADAGFTVEECRTLDGSYVLLSATP
jgi:SAM-dependent methyltransferase